MTPQQAVARCYCPHPPHSPRCCANCTCPQTANPTEQAADTIREALYDKYGPMLPDNAALAALKVLEDAAKRTYHAETQRWVDEVCHYRNLAIAYGAKPDEMLSKFDRDLVEKHAVGLLGAVDEARAETKELWQEHEEAVARADTLTQALEKIADVVQTLPDYQQGSTTDPPTLTVRYLKSLARAALAAATPNTQQRCPTCDKPGSEEGE